VKRIAQGCSTADGRCMRVDWKRMFNPRSSQLRSRLMVLGVVLEQYNIPAGAPLHSFHSRTPNAETSTNSARAAARTRSAG
jgi:hypothetical protein